MRLFAHVGIVGILALCVSGCATDANACPLVIPASADKNQDDASWGSDTTRVRAEIGAAVAECVPVATPLSEKTDSRVLHDYAVLVTVQVGSQIVDHAFYDRVTKTTPFVGTVVFDAVSKSGVVMGTANAVFHPVGLDASPVSARIGGITADEIRRIDRVVVRWNFEK